MTKKAVKMRYSAVLFTASALLLVLAELGQSAPAQDPLSGPQREAIQNYYQQFARAQANDYSEWPNVMISGKV